MPLFRFGIIDTSLVKRVGCTLIFFSLRVSYLGHFSSEAIKSWTFLDRSVVCVCVTIDLIQYIIHAQQPLSLLHCTVFQSYKGPYCWLSFLIYYWSVWIFPLFSLSLLAVTSATELHPWLWIFLCLHDSVFVGGYAFLISNLTYWW